MKRVIRIGENATQMISEENFRGFYYIYTLVDEQGTEVKCFFRPDLIRLGGVERRYLVLREHKEFGFNITEVALVDKAEWYTAKLDYDVEVYKHACKDYDEANRGFWEDDIKLTKTYEMLMQSLESMKEVAKKQIIRSVNSMVAFEIPVMNELAIEIVKCL